jgi:hypothetical protein
LGVEIYDCRSITHIGHNWNWFNLARCCNRWIGAAAVASTTTAIVVAKDLILHPDGVVTDQDGNPVSYTLAAQIDAKTHFTELPPINDFSGAKDPVLQPNQSLSVKNGHFVITTNGKDLKLPDGITLIVGGESALMKDGKPFTWSLETGYKPAPEGLIQAATTKPVENKTSDISGTTVMAVSQTETPFPDLPAIQSAADKLSTEINSGQCRPNPNDFKNDLEQLYWNIQQFTINPTFPGMLTSCQLILSEILLALTKATSPPCGLTQQEFDQLKEDINNSEQSLSQDGNSSGLRNQNNGQNKKLFQQPSPQPSQQPAQQTVQQPTTSQANAAVEWGQNAGKGVWNRAKNAISTTPYNTQDPNTAMQKVKGTTPLGSNARILGVGLAERTVNANTKGKWSIGAFKDWALNFLGDQKPNSDQETNSNQKPNSEK